MASVQKVQSYLAYWFQLGKPVVLQHRNVQTLPAPVFQGAGLSPSFQACWQQAMEHPQQSFLEGTDESIAELLSDEWDIEGCARCTMPIPMPVRGVKVSPCPCADLPSWPNETIPPPRSGVCSHTYLNDLRTRLDQVPLVDRDRLQDAYSQSPALQPPSAPLATDQSPMKPSGSPAQDEQ